MIRRLPRWARRLPAALAAGSALAVVAFIAWPPPHDLLRRQPHVLRVLDRDGLPLREVLPDGVERALPLPPGPLPPRLVQAFVATEDRRFFTHHGVDPLALARTLRDSARARRITGGASTITQQLARLLVPRPRTLIGKARETAWALRLDLHHDKKELLRAYLDRVALGVGTRGVEAAARAYFGRPAAALSTAQSALLAGLAAAPARFDPRRHPVAARARLRHVVARMRALSFLSAEEARVAADDPLDLAPPRRALRAPHFGQHVRSEVPPGVAQVVTTLDLALQRDVEEMIVEELAGLGERGVGEAAALVVDNATGEVLAWAGSAAFDDDDGQNDGVLARRQPGSTLKPFAYGLALASGMTPADIIPDVPARFATAAGDFAPRNYDRRTRGPVRLRAALANSYNVPAVRVVERLGVERLLALLQDAGLASLTNDASHYGLGLVLGDGEVSLYELARAYAALARGGVLRPLVVVRDPPGAVPAPAFAPRRILPAPAVALLTDILADEGARVPAFGLDNALRLPFPVAVKTGTSRAHVDNWTIGFTRERTVAVWVGNFDGRPMNDVSGVTGAGPLFRRVMVRAMRGVVPETLVDRSAFERATICPLSGGRAGARCPASLEEVFLHGSAPRATCPMHGEEGLELDPAFDRWARAEGLPLAPARAARTILISPADGDEFLLDPGVPLADQAVPVRARAAAGTTALAIVLDGTERGALQAPFATRVVARRGLHTIELRDVASGVLAARARFRVR